MSKIAIVTDSTADIPKDLIEKFKIKVVPLYLNFEDRSYLEDGIDITSKQFYEKLKVVKKQPTTSQPTPQDFIKVYNELLEENDTIISIHISQKMSGTFSSAEIARKELAGKDIEVIDTGLVHMPLGVLVLKAAELVLDGKSKEEILKTINDLKQKITILFIPNTLKYLIMNGRIGRAKGLIASVLEIRPILTIHMGEVSQFKTTRRFSQAKNELINSMKSVVKDTSKLMVIVSDSDAKEEGDEMSQRIKETFNPKQIMRATIGAVVGNNIGPGGIAVTFYEE
ncbi:MAG: DegV family protein [Actinobacteria bacterium]|nr:DegV family protein [Actinomycetota bacterium]